MVAPTRSVLLVEDDEAIAEMLRDFFERDGYRFLHALTGEEAVERLRIRPVSAVLLDINLRRRPPQAIVSAFSGTAPRLPK